MKRVTPDELRAALWGLRSARLTKRQLVKGGLQADIQLPAVPTVPRTAERGVKGVLRRIDATCLVRAIVLQRFRARFGESVDVIVGVTAPRTGFKAHAWLDGEEPCHDEGFAEMVRLGSDRAAR